MIPSCIHHPIQAHNWRKHPGRIKLALEGKGLILLCKSPVNDGVQNHAKFSFGNTAPVSPEGIDLIQSIVSQSPINHSSLISIKQSSFSHLPFVSSTCHLISHLTISFKSPINETCGSSVNHMSVDLSFVSSIYHSISHQLTVNQLLVIPPVNCSQ